MDVVSTDQIPAHERFAFWREMNTKLHVPFELRCDAQMQSAFRAHVGFSAFGPVRASLVTVTPHSAHRTHQLIRQADPEVFELACTVRGAATVTHNGQRAEQGAGDMVLVDTSRPYQVEHAPYARGSQVMLLHFPRSLLSLPDRDLRRLSGMRIPGTQGIGALSSQFLVQLAQQLPVLSPSRTSRLSTLILDVLATALADALDTQSTVPPHTRQRALMAQVHAFVRNNLHRPELGPATIAAAHHISLRYLHKLFQQDGRTVAGWIRECRLERCRRDLADPRLAARPIHAIASRWGFTNPAYFSQAFRSVYGVSPRQFRRRSHVLPPG
ncbi:helix-turn-helix domain-containing protein [Streptomyces sp. NBC_00414]|uniref:AraC-like ligand-binding domain-containing protein n=1 Tax=Streptomyces sp. NBC_00414 TaxID=2975739 RepID=UPI002E20E130